MTDDDPIIDGKAVASTLVERAATKVRAIQEAAGVTPCLATVIVGEDPGSATYVRMKRKRCEAAGMTSRLVQLSAETSTEELISTIRDLGEDDGVHGVLLQHPVPEHVDERAAFDAIPVHKDVDGVTSTSLGHMMLGTARFGSCTPAGIMRLLAAYGVEIAGAEAVVLGRSAILGRPMMAMLLNANATVTVCHSRTRDLPSVLRRADCLIAGVGRPKFVQGDWVKEGAVVVDAGYNPGNVGDVDFETAAPRARRITPVPGGVGPMTIATLIDQTADAAAEATGVEVPS